MFDTIIETIKFYADNGDLLTAAYMSLVFYDLIATRSKFEVYLQRILCSYFETL